MMTNWRTISNLDQAAARAGRAGLATDVQGLTKKETLQSHARARQAGARARRHQGDGRPAGFLFVIDTNKEAIAVAEANKLASRWSRSLDSNSDPHGINFPIPGNDDALRAISLYCDLVVEAVLDGIQQEMVAAGTSISERRRSRSKAASAEAAGRSVDATVGALPIEACRKQRRACGR